MPHTTYSFYFLLICLGVSLVLIYFIAQPFLTPLILAAVFAFFFQPLYRDFLRLFRGWPSLAASATTGVIIILIVLPILILGIQIFHQSAGLYKTILGNNNDLVSAVNVNIDKLYAVAPVLKDLNINISEYLQNGLSAITQNVGTIFSNVTKLVLDMCVFLIACYFLLKDGPKLEEYLMKINPLPREDNNMIANRLKAAVSSVIKGSLLVGLIQGILCGVGFLILGVPNALLWGSLAVIAAIIPGIGTGLVTVPVILFSFFSGNPSGTLWLVVLALFVGVIDNFIRPKLVGNSIQMHPLVVFITVIGGIIFFGPVGFLLGPLVIVIFIALVDIYLLLRVQGNLS